MDVYSKDVAISEIFDAEASGEITEDEFDDGVWLYISNRIGTIEELKNYPLELTHYYASRLMEWEVGNGGFSQAAFNIIDWFDLAADGYRALNLNKAANLIEKAKPLAVRENRRDRAVLGISIGELFARFSESKLANYDEMLDEVGWWASEARMRYVKKHKDVFIKVT